MKSNIEKIRSAEYCGNRSNKKTLVPTKNYLLPVYFVANKIHYSKKASTVLADKISSLLLSAAWEESGQNTRAPQVIALLARSLEYSIDNDLEIIESFQKVAKEFTKDIPSKN